MDYKDRLRAARKHAGLTQAELAERIRVTQVSISDLERGKSASSSHSYTIAQECGVSPDWLIHGRGEMLPPAQTVAPAGFDANVVPVEARATRRAPVISWVQAGAWTETVDLYAPGYAEEWEEVDAKDRANIFWLKVAGDSMTAPYGLSVPEGFLIKVDPDKQYENGSLVVAKLTDNQEATFKKLVLDAGQKFLKPLNPAYPAIPINGNCRIVGVVTEIKLKL